MADTFSRISNFDMKLSALLLHLDEVKAGGLDSDYFIDSSRYNHTIARTGNNIGIGAVNKFPPGGLVGSPGYDKAFWRVHQGLNMEADFTFDFWFYDTAYGGALGSDLSSMGVRLGYDKWPIGLAHLDNILEIYTEDTTGGQGYLHCTFYAIYGGILGVTIPITAGYWKHVAFVKSGSTHSFYLNGALIQDWVADTNFSAYWWLPPFEHYNYDPAYNPEHSITTNCATTSSKPIYVDEVHLEPRALWTAPFTPPTIPYRG